MRKLLSAYLSKIYLDIDWEERCTNPLADAKLQFVSPLMDRQEALAGLAKINGVRKNINEPNADFFIVKSRGDSGKYRIACNLKKELYKEKLNEMAHFLHEIYGSAQHDAGEAKWQVENSDGKDLLVIRGTPLLVRYDFNVEEFVLRVGGNVNHPCYAKVKELANTGVKCEGGWLPMASWKEEGLYELYQIMFDYKKELKEDVNIKHQISIKVAEKALMSSPLPYELNRHIGFFLSLADAGVLAQVNRASQEALRQAKLASDNCERNHEESVNTLSQ